MRKKLLLMISVVGVFCLICFASNLYAAELMHHEVYKLEPGMNLDDIMKISFFNKYTKFAYDYQSTGYVHLIEKSGAKRQRVFLRKRIILGKEEEGIDYKDVTSFTGPTSVKGLGVLSWTYIKSGQDSDQWIWIPSLKKIRKVSASQGDDSFMGTDFTTEEVTTRKYEEETYTLLREEAFEGYSSDFDGLTHLAGADCYVVEARPKRDPWYYSKRVVWIDKATGGMMYQEIYDPNGTMFKTIYTQYVNQDVGEREYSVQNFLEVKNLRNGHMTVIEFKDIAFDQGQKESDFSERMLQRSKW